MPFCPMCADPTDRDNRFCARCGRSLVDDPPGGAFTAGGNIIQGGLDVGAGIAGSFNVTTYSSNDGSRRVTEMRRTGQTRLPLRPPGPRTTVLGLMASLATILALLLKLPPVADHPVPASLVSLAIVLWILFWRVLRERRYLPLNLIKGGPPHGLEIDDAGSLYYTTIVVSCPDCGERMGLHKTDDKRPILICKRGRQLHRLMFDDTQLPPLTSDESPDNGRGGARPRWAPS